MSQELEVVETVGYLPYEIDCLRVRYCLQHAVSSAFQVPVDSVKFGEHSPIAGGVEVWSTAQVEDSTRDRMFQFVRGFCMAHNQRID